MSGWIEKRGSAKLGVPTRLPLVSLTSVSLLGHDLASMQKKEGW